MRTENHSFRLISALLLLLVFVVKIGVDYHPESPATQKIKSITDSNENEDANEDEPEKKTESKEFLVEDFTIGTFIRATTNKFRIHDDELISLASKVITLPPKKV